MACTSAAGRDHEAVRSVPPAATHQFGVFIATQAHAAGWSRHGLEWAMQAGHLVRPLWISASNTASIPTLSRLIWPFATDC